MSKITIGHGYRFTPRQKARKSLTHIKRAGKTKAAVRGSQRVREKAPARDLATAMRRI